MKKHHLAILWLVAAINGQTLVDVRTQTKNVDFSGAASTIPTQTGTSLPSSCKVGAMFFNTNNAPGQNLYLCSPANTWTVLAGGGGSTVGTVLTANTGQFAFYAGNGSTISGHTLVPADIPALNYQAPLSFTGTGAKTASSTGTTTANNCVKWDSNGNVIDAGSTCSTPVLQSSSHIAEGDSITYGYHTTGTCNNGGTNSCAYPSLLAFDERAALTNRAISGSQACNVVAQQTVLSDVSSIDNNPIYTMMIGTNDANVKGVGSYESVFEGCHKAGIAWIAVPNKVAANSTNCVDTGSWTASSGWAINGEYSTTNGSTKTCSVQTYGGPLYAWYYIQDSSGGAFTYSVDGGTPVALTTATTPAIATQNGGTFGWSLIRVPVSAGSHSIKFVVTSATGSSNAVDIGAIGTPPAELTYGYPRVFVGGVPRQVGDADSAATAEYNADVQADVNQLSGDGLGVYFVNVRNYLCTVQSGGLCYNSAGAQDMTANSVSPEDMLHPNDIGQNELKQAFEQAEQFTPYIPSITYTGSGTKTVTSTAAGTSGDCAKWDANGNIVDAGSPCGTGSGGSGSSAWSALTPGTNTAGAFVIGSAASLAVSGTGTIAATSVPASGVSGTLAATNLPSPTATTLGGVESVATTPHQWINSISTAGVPASSQPAFSDLSGTLTASQLPTPTSSSLGGVQSVAAVSHQWMNSISTSGVPTLLQPAFSDVSGVATDAQLPSDQCTLAKYTVQYTQLTAAASATPSVTLFSLPSTSTRICLLEISGTQSFTGSAITAGTVRLQSGATTPVLYSPNQDIFGTVGPTTNNYWTDSGNMADRTSQSVVAQFTFTGATSSALTQGAVTITVGTRTMP